MDIAVDATRSQNMTVSWRRSAAASLRSGATAIPPTALCPAVAGTCAAQCAQYFASRPFSAPQLGQRGASEAPHSVQNLVPSGLSKVQWAQRTNGPLADDLHVMYVQTRR